MEAGQFAKEQLDEMDDMLSFEDRMELNMIVDDVEEAKKFIGHTNTSSV